MRYLKWFYIIGGWALFVLFIVKLFVGSSDSADKAVMHNYKPILIHANALICYDPEKLSKGIEYWQTGDMKGFNILLRSNECILTAGPFKAYLVDEYNDISSTSSLVFVEFKDHEARYYHIAKGAYSNWPKNWK